MLIFHYNALPVNNTFAAGLIVPAPIVTEARRTAADEPTDADRVEWYFKDEINREVELIAAEREATWALERGYNHS